MTSSRIVRYVLGILLLISVTLGADIFKSNAPGLLSLYALDVGQGDALLITEGDIQVLIDGGPRGDVLLKELTRILPPRDRTIELVVLTHPQADHMAGLLDVLDRYRVLRVLTPNITYESALFRSWQEALGAEHAPVFSARAGQIVYFGNAALQVLYPFNDPGGVLMDSGDANDASAILKLIYGDTTALFTGDAELKTEFDLLRAGMNVESDLLKVGHHGSRTSSSNAFLDAIDPRVALISLGRNNTFGHPHKEVIERLGTNKITVYRTDQAGTIHFMSNGSHWCNKQDNQCFE